MYHTPWNLTLEIPAFAPVIPGQYNYIATRLEPPILDINRIEASAILLKPSILSDRPVMHIFSLGLNATLPGIGGFITDATHVNSQTIKIHTGSYSPAYDTGIKPGVTTELKMVLRSTSTAGEYDLEFWVQGFLQYVHRIVGVGAGQSLDLCETWLGFIQRDASFSTVLGGVTLYEVDAIRGTIFSS